MKFIKQDLLTLLISLFILSSCTSPDSVGLEVDPDYAINGTLITSPVEAVTVREDTVGTSGLSKFPLGYIKDPVLGTTEANLALSLSVPSANFSFGKNTNNTLTLDSAVLVLDYASDFYGDSLSSVYQINVHKLTEDVPASVYNNKVFTFNPAVIGTKDVRVRFRDSVKVRAIVEGKADVDSSYAPQVRIPMSADFGNSFLLADSTIFADNTKLKALVQGLYLAVNKTNSTGPGGIMFFDLATAGASKLEVYYRKTTGTTIDTSVVRFPIRSGSAPVAATFRHDYTGTPVEAQLNNPNATHTATYVQGLAGLKNRIRFPELTNLRSLGNITINKAELVLEVEGEAVPFTPVPRLFLYRTDIAGQKQLLPDVTDTDFRAITDLQFGGFYNSNSKRYVFSVTSYVQDIVNGRSKQYDAYITPADITSDKYSAINPSGTVASRSILPKAKMKLNIIYTSGN